MAVLGYRPEPGLRGPTLPRSPNLARCSPGRGESGMVTAELAVVLPAVVLVLALSLGAIGLALDQVRCVDAASAGARAAARGDSRGSVIRVATRAAPAAARVSMDASGDLVRVSVVSPPRVAQNLLPGWLRASATASAVREQADPRG